MALINGEEVQLAPGDSLAATVKGYVENDDGFDVTGQRVQSPIDAAALFGAMRSPFVERTAWMVNNLGETTGVVDAPFRGVNWTNRSSNLNETEACAKSKTTLWW